MDYEKLENEVHEALKDNIEGRFFLCERFTNTRTIPWEKSLQAISRSDLSCADNYLLQKVATAFTEFERGNYQGSKKTFAECGAIILRCMNYVDEHEFVKKDG